MLLVTTNFSDEKNILSHAQYFCIQIFEQIFRFYIRQNPNSDLCEKVHKIGLVNLEKIRNAQDF